MKDSKKGIGFTYAWNGLLKVFKNERNFRIHLIALIAVIIVSLYFQLSLLEWAIVLLVSALVLVTEIVNSTIEVLIDYLFIDHHETAKVIKDLSAAAVLVSALFAIIIGLLIFLPKLF